MVSIAHDPTTTVVAETMFSSYEDDIEQIRTAAEFYQLSYPNLEEDFTVLQALATARVAVNHFVTEVGDENFEGFDSSIQSLSNGSVDVQVRTIVRPEDFHRGEKAAEVLLTRLLDEGINPTIQVQTTE